MSDSVGSKHLCDLGASLLTCSLIPGPALKALEGKEENRQGGNFDKMIGTILGANAGDPERRGEAGPSPSVQGPAVTPETMPRP